MESLGVPTFLRKPLFTRGLPWLEIVVALGLLLCPAPLFRLFAVGSLLLSVVFLITIWIAVTKDEPAQCNCFGSKKTTVSIWTFIRNSVLVLMSIVFVISSNSGFFWSEHLFPAILGLAALVISTLGGIAVSPEFTHGQKDSNTIKSSSDLGLRNLQLQTIDLRAKAAEKPIVLLFTKKGCPSCMIAADSLKSWSTKTAGLAVAYIVLDGTPEEAMKFHSDFSDNLLLDSGLMAARLMNFTRFPAAFLIGRDGLFATNGIEGPQAIDEFLDVLNESLTQNMNNASI